MNETIEQRIERLEYNEKVKDIMIITFAIIIIVFIGGILIFS